VNPTRELNITSG